MAATEDLKKIATDTVAALKKRSYTLENGDVVPIGHALHQAVSMTKLYTPAMFDTLTEKRKQLVADASTQPLRIHYANAGTIETAEKLVASGERTVCLNFASGTRPGGGFLDGAKAQEEAIARASGLYPCLLKCPDYYKINKELGSSLYTDHMIYSPDVPVIRNEYGRWLEAPYCASVITSPAPNKGILLRKEPEKIKDVENVLSSRIEKILTIAAVHKHKTLVLGAWGCGVFQNDPYLVARLFKSHLVESGEFKNIFHHIVFAVLDPTNKHENTKAFLETFGRTCETCDKD